MNHSIPPSAPTRTRSTLLVLGLACFGLHSLPAVDEVKVDIFGGGGAGKFNKANITREENKIIQAVFAGTGNDVLEAIITDASGHLLVCGNFGTVSDPRRPLPEVAPGGTGGTAFVARLSPDGRQMQRLLRLPPAFLSARCIAAAPDGTSVVAGEAAGDQLIVARLAEDLGSIVWTRTVVGDRAVSVAVAPDNSVVVSPAEKPFVSRIKPDGSGLVPFGAAENFRTDGGNPDVYKAWWLDLGYPEAGYKRGATYHRGGNGGVVALSDGTFVLFTTHFLHHPGGGPDFDPMLLKFDGEGKILWCTNLLEGLPAESDHKQARLGLDPHTGDLLLACIQHGHFAKNLIHTANAFLNPHAWFTGDIMIGWIARVDPATGKPKAATYYFPEMPGPMQAGKRRANSLFPQAPTADASGNIYVTGKTAWKLGTTIHAFQAEPLGGSGFVSVFNADLSRLLYASLVTSKGFDFDPRGIVLGAGGPAVVGTFQQKKEGPYEFVHTNEDVANFLIPQPAANAGAFFGYYPSKPWDLP